MTLAITTSEKVLEIATLLIVSMATIIGNILILIIIFMNQGLRTHVNACVGNLCITGILIGSFNIPMTMVSIGSGDWPFDAAVCQFVGFFNMLTLVESVISLGVISVNRFIMISHHQIYSKIFNFRHTSIILAASWLFSGSISLPPAIGWASYKYIATQSICFCDWKHSVSYTVFMFCLCFTAPFGIMTFCYTKLILAFRRSHNRVRARSPQKRNDELIQPRDEMPVSETTISLVPFEQNRLNVPKRKDKIIPEEMKLTISLMVVVVTFVLSWLPFCVEMFITVFSEVTLNRAGSMTVLVLGLANSAYNPIIYGIMNKQYQEGFKKICPKCWKRQNITTNKELIVSPSSLTTSHS
ncbi:unnamed protein product [Owenia fusiformis]|uniref:G-protein coupled receptors family 1 profile domain-containing protein n=1 Tax=Owenia fusiformis TaxID=6347 RepID=A0A8S4NJ10_OWEFU|nr:unnamed protein product [Owenia fusiformis]